MKFKTIIFAVGSLLSLSAFAQHGHMDRGQYNQERRIEQGVRYGSLNRHEARQLQRGQYRIDRMKAQARADGIVTPYERARIREEKRRQERKIYRKKHNQY